MSSSSMPPPPTPLAHRRSTRLIVNKLPSSPPYSTDTTTSCGSRKMSLSKGATFHCPSSPPSQDDPVLSIRHLARRSPTCSQSMLASWLSDKQDVVQSLEDFEHTWSGARGTRNSLRRRSGEDFEQQLRERIPFLPSDEGLGSSVSSPSDKGLVRSFERALDIGSEKDSGLGTSIIDSMKEITGPAGHTSEEESLVVDLIQETDAPDSAPRPRQLGNRHRSRAPKPSTSFAVTQSIAPPSTRRASHHPSLNVSARKKFTQYILGPILREDRFRDLHPLVTSLSSKSNKTIKCLRDLEQSLIFDPLTLAISQQLYRTFGEFSVQLVVDTYPHLSESEQRRAADRPYDNGYFLDLVQQVGRLASYIGTSAQQQQAAVTAAATEREGENVDDEMAYSPDDEVTLEGGLGDTGDVAELVRWKNGKGVSLRTGKPYEPLSGIKRQSSGSLDDEAERSMARRKKGYIPEIIEMKCSDRDCDKIFTRKCDLAKHEKTHSRPFKCPDKTCKYHDMGLPTEKERDRHINDKHDLNPHYFKCQFCEFRTKRESNCKQHQEKKHNWVYERAKGKDKAAKATPNQTPQTPNMDYSSGMQSPAVSYRSSHWEDGSAMTGSNVTSAQPTPYEQPSASFDNYNHLFSAPLFPRQSAPPMQYPLITDNQGFDVHGYGNLYQVQGHPYISPTDTAPRTPYMGGTPITPAYSNITGQSPFTNNMDQTDCGIQPALDTGLPTPGSFLQPSSRNPSISHMSPTNLLLGDQSFINDPMIGQGMDLPSGDFSLFNTEMHTAFSNPAAASATLFPTTEFEKLNDDPMYDPMNWDDEAEFVDYNMTN